MTEFLIGCDPELFVTKNDKLVSAYGLIPGTKHAPFEVDGGAVQVDGMALEFNINPAKTSQEFNDNINKVLGHLQQLVGEEYKFVFSPVAEFGQAYIDAQPSEAKELGCDPDYNVYTGGVNPKPDANLGIRTASGHVHVGWTDGQDVNDPDHIEACQMVVRQLDVTLGFASKIWDRDTTRASMYGQVGTYRVKPYGVEYRTPSNVWVTEPSTRKIVFDITMNAVKQLLSGKRIYENYNPHDINNWTYSDKLIITKAVIRDYGLLDKQGISDLVAIYDKNNNNPYKTGKTVSGGIKRRSVQPAPVWAWDQPIAAAPQIQIMDDLDVEAILNEAAEL